MPVPFALAQLIGYIIRGGNKYKSVIADVLTSDIKCPTQVTLERTSCLVVDDTFVDAVLRSGHHFDRMI